MQNILLCLARVSKFLPYSDMEHVLDYISGIRCDFYIYPIPLLYDRCFGYEPAVLAVERDAYVLRTAVLVFQHYNLVRDVYVRAVILENHYILI